MSMSMTKRELRLQLSLFIATGHKSARPTQLPFKNNNQTTFWFQNFIHNWFQYQQDWFHTQTYGRTTRYRQRRQTDVCRNRLTIMTAHMRAIISLLYIFVATQITQSAIVRLIRTVSTDLLQLRYQGNVFKLEPYERNSKVAELVQPNLV